MKIALLVIATGPRYWPYAERLLASARRFFPEHHAFVWTDRAERFDAFRQFQKLPLGYPLETLYRYHTILTEEAQLRSYDQIFYCDADMEFVALVSLEDVASDGITATLHPGYYVQNWRGDPELRPESRAYCPNATRYFCGGFNGGSAWVWLEAASTIKNAVDDDSARGITARWHDESHWNRYLYDRPPARVLTPSYCFPEGSEEVGYCGWTARECPPILVALTKR